ncbi:MAG: carbon-nitrogen hydrolase family protein [Amphritea sp.]
MRVTVCELLNDPATLEHQWQRLTEHALKERSEFILLPEMPFASWPCADLGTGRQNEVWQAAIASHQQWCKRITALNLPVALTQPVIDGGSRLNRACLIEGERTIDAHDKYYLPDEEGFWEASWYQRGDACFDPVVLGDVSMGFLICTEVWAQEWARHYGKRGVNMILNPRANYLEDKDIWQAGNRATAFVSGTYLLTSNLLPIDAEGVANAWVISPDGDVLIETTAEQPFATIDIDLQASVEAKKSYPCYAVE